jgi:hypothetical protein
MDLGLRVRDLHHGPFNITTFEGKNSFLLENMDGKFLNAPINRRYLKHFMQ